MLAFNRTSLDQFTQKKKPEMIPFYNKNKVGVDGFNLMARFVYHANHIPKMAYECLGKHAGHCSNKHLDTLHEWHVKANWPKKIYSFSCGKTHKQDEKNGINSVILRPDLH